MKYVCSDDNYSILHSNEYDALELAPIMRDSDIQEIMASHGKTPIEALMDGLEKGVPCLSLRYKQEMVAMFGVTPLSREAGVIWLLGSPAIKDISELFIELSHKVIELFLEDYSYLFNYVDYRNDTSIRWLSKCGASFHEPEIFGLAQIPFSKFEFRRDY